MSEQASGGRQAPGGDDRERALARAKQALRLASADMPHLAGLAHLVRLKVTNRIGVAAVSSSGLVLVNPQVFATVPLADAAFVLAHELLHLALDTHEVASNAQLHRQGGARTHPNARGSFRMSDSGLGT